MKIEYVQLLALLGIGAVLIGSFFVEERPSVRKTDDSGASVTLYQGHGVPHADHPTMLAGGPGYARAAHILGIGTIFGFCVFVFIIASVRFGLRNPDPERDPSRPFWAISLLYLFVLAGLIVSYRAYIADDSLRLFASIPVPTAWIVYGIWTVPGLYMLLYVVGFERYVWNDTDEAKFQAILKRNAASRGND